MAQTGPHQSKPEQTTEIRVERPKSWLRRELKIHAYIPETLGLVGVMAVLNMALLPARPGFMGLEPNPFWAVILLMASRYGFRAGLLSSLVAAGTYMGLVATRVGDEVITMRDLVSWQYASPAVLFLLGGVIVGMLVQRHKNRIDRLERENEELIRSNLALKKGEEELRDVNIELANRVVGATDTLPVLYKYAKKLNALDVGEIFTALTELVQEVTKAQQVSVYKLEGNRLPLHSRNGKRQQGGELRLEPELAELLLVRRQTVALHDLLDRNIRREDFFLCGPLMAGTSGQVLALLAVEELEFLRYNPGTVRLFSVVVDWAGASLDKAAQYRERPEELKMVEARTTIMRAQRATLSPGVISADMVSAAAGVVGRTDPGMQHEESGSTVAPGLPEGRPAHPAGLSRGATAPGASALGQLLDQAHASLFRDAAPAAESGSRPAAPEVVEMESRAALQHMLTGELQIASTQGTPLAKLLNEINGYLSSQKGGGE